ISRHIILNFKYSKVFECGDFIVSDILNHFPELYKRIEFDYITCVPTHFIKFAIRGYNHTQYISKKLSAELGIPFRKLVSRTRYVKSQTKVPHSRRSENIKNSFRLCVKENLENKNILLFEDVITSGNTIKEITAELSAAKANVFVLAYADARHPQQLEDNIVHGYKL
ncbi:MAG: ComF family protein, partial [Armatimonadetes bacterium]|nr:ComF family protein [Candidatus Hippobium faecium]